MAWKLTISSSSKLNLKIVTKFTPMRPLIIFTGILLLIFIPIGVPPVSAWNKRFLCWLK